MLQFFKRLFGLKQGGGDRSRHVETGHVFPVHFIDRGGLIGTSIMSYTLRFNDVLDPEKLHSSLVELLKIGDWKKLGGRLRRNESGDIVIRVPETYDPEHPAVRYSHVQFDIGIEEHPLACRLPKQTGPYPSAQEGYLSFRSFSVPEDWRDELKHYYTSDKPLISLRVVSFTDATLVAITSPHLVCDAIAMADLLKAWSIVLAGRIDCVPTLLGASRDVIESVGTSSDKEAGNPYFLEHRQIKGFSLLVFIVRFVWDVLIRRNVRPGTIYLPASFVRKLRQEAQEQLAAKAQIVSDLFLSDGDLITAWGSHMVLSCSPRKPAIICNVFELRSRLDGVFSPGGTYLQNLVLPVFSLLSAEEMATMSVGHIALKIRQAIVEQATGAQARRLMRVMRAAIASTGLMPLFGDSASQVIAWSNWSKARIQKSVNFSPAVITTQGDPRPVNSTSPPGTCVWYWGAAIGKNNTPPNAFMIYGRDDLDGGYLLSAQLHSETWDLIETEFSQYRATCCST
ncbi:hypothetical protein ASPZODRAFT_15186 [Penicilliopsis zonata CBS 506.65]|uniref:Uncharacterized protein n=1 Tax=Penicilliopsis zonata CBS 506.65 TaxID=1073090 RepID=A0A1L9SKK6_9EURO|nr:hypothetical protein ASPZODRAFT_15186 [Penicilliopsis zonata CBS 506.65]OJJ47738.1 hypothetical protein ASPZODRAFT_15186 [Penicilliopsis zonata CBS 506.65]